MTDIVRSSSGVTLVGAGQPLASDIEEALRLAPTLVAADGGATFCLDAGHVPDAVIGDFDSLNQGDRPRLGQSRLIHVAEQDSTDFEKCLRRIAAPFVLATGFTDARLDHTLAAMTTLARRIGPTAIIIAKDDIVFSANAEVVLDLPVGSRLSLFPMGQVQGESLGLEWPIDGLTLAPDGRIGTSNRVVGPVHLSFDRPGCLVLVPRDALSAVFASLGLQTPNSAWS